jgi:phosphatidylglycerophosphate synthase
MEKHETLKKLEKTKAKIIFAMILLLLSLPSLVMRGSDKKVVLLLLFIPLVVALLYKRICRLNYKIESIK